MSDEIRISADSEDSEASADRPRTIRFNPSDPSASGPASRPSEGLRIDPAELSAAPPEDERLPSPAGGVPSDVSSDEAETYLGAPSVASSASEFSGEDLDTQNLGVMLQDRYRLQRVLGKGGFGVVYLAHDRVLDQDVAIKVLKLGAATEGYKKRFIFEARTAAKLRHMAIVNVFDIVQTEGGLQLVMEFYPGGTMADLIKRDGKIQPKEALGYIRQIALGLGMAHKKGIIHRDIKPANIFFSDDQMVKLGDFGICASYESHDHTMTGEVIGTPLYMAPEQQKDSKDVDPRADIYALAMTLYHMITGRPPRVVNLEDLPPRIRPLIQQATAYDRKERPASCQQLVAMIDQIVKNWDQADEEMRASSTEMLAAHAEGDGPDPGPGMQESGESGGPRAVSTRTSDPLPPTGQSGWDPSEITHTQHRTAHGDTTTTTVIHSPTSTWSMVALVGVIIAGFLAVIFMLVRQNSPSGVSIAENRGVTAVQPVASPAPDESEVGSAAAQDEETATGEEVDDAQETSPEPAMTAETDEAPDPDPPAEPVVSDPEPAPAETWVPVQPEWANENHAGDRGIDDFLARQSGNEVVTFTRDTFLILGDWVENRSTPSAMIFRDSARNRLEQAIERFPEEPLFPYLLGRLHEAAGNAPKAEAQFDRVAALDPGFVADFDGAVLELLRDLDLEKDASQSLRSFLLTPSTLARRSASS